MICLLLIMMVIFVNGIEGAEQRSRHSDTVLREEEMSAKTKAWLLMVESGKVDEEELRRITPKSIFIAPLLTSRTGKCKDGYRHDHLGQCVKVIKIDPKVQLELLLKRLNNMYAEKKKEEEGLSQISNEPLHFSIPISNIDDKLKTKNNNTKSDTQATANSTMNATTSKTERFPEFMPIPLPVVMMNLTNQTKEIESSGTGPLNESEPYETSQLEGSGVGSGDEPPPEEETISPVTLLPEEADYLDVTETSSTTEMETTTEFTTETTTTVEPPVEETNSTNSTESYQSITDEPGVYDSVTDPPLDNTYVQNTQVVTKNSKSDIIHFPSDDEVRTHASPSSESVRIRFPDEVPQPQLPSYHSFPSLPEFQSQYRNQAPPIPQEQFWWLPENWKVDENHQQKSALVKFWSRLPLIHDISYSDESSNFKKSFLPSQPPPPSPIYNPQSNSQDFPVHFKQKLPPVRLGKPFRGNRFQDFLQTPRQNFRIQR